MSYLASELEQKILSLGPEAVAGFIFAPIVGAAGIVPAPPLGDTLTLAPPYNASDAELEEITSKRVRAIAGALGRRI